MEKKTGSAGTPVAPAAPTEALEADTADPGEVEEAKAAQKTSKTGKYGTSPAQPFQPPPAGTADPKETHWIEIDLVDDDGKPVSGEAFSVTTSDDRVYKGTLDRNGHARLEGLPAGSTQVRFPKLDDKAWEKA